jgi:phosphatidylserine/phosphatidylglycerophosphate/cardiolipin synthase-like enzyme
LKGSDVTRFAFMLAMALAAGATGAQSLPAPPIAAQGTIQVAFTPWDDAEGMILDVITGARQQILVQAYSFTSRKLANALVAARRRGVDVQLLADREQTFSGDSSRISELVAAGIPVALEVLYQSAHSKIMIIDAGTSEPAVIAGSYNWTYAAQNRNAENVLVFRRHPQLARQYLANWQRHAQDALPYSEARQ